MAEKKELLTTDEILKQYNEWKISNGADENSAPKFDVSSMGGSVGTTSAMPTIITDQAANRIWSDTYQSIKDPTKLQGSSAQKHGVVAERLEVGKANAENVKNGGTGDIASLSDSGIDEVTDLTINGQNYQSKFYRTPRETYKAFKDNPKYDKVGKLVPKDQYQKVVELAKADAESYRSQAQACKQNGDMAGYEKNMSEAKRCDNIAKTAKPSEYTYNDSQHGKLTIAKEVAKGIGKNATKAGAKAGGTAFVISGFTNAIQVAKGEKEAAQAIIDTAKTTGTAAATGFGVTAGGEVISLTVTQIAKKVGEGTVNKALTTFANSSAPTYVVLATIEVTKSMVKYSRGELSKSELAIELGEKAFCTTISAVVGTLTAELGPLSIVFSTASYMVASSLYRGTVEAIRLAKDAAQVRELLPMLEAAYEDLCKQTIELENYLKEQTNLREKVVTDAFKGMQDSLLDNDLTSFNNSLGKILEIYADGLKFKSFEEFDSVMKDSKSTVTI